MKNEAQTRLDLIDPALFASDWKGHFEVEHTIATPTAPAATFFLPT